MTEHPPLGLIDVYAATIPTLAFAPASCQLCRDGAADEGRPAQAEGFPAELGGSGVAIPE